MHRLNKQARVSLFTVFSIIALILFMMAAWAMLDISLNTYKKMLGSKQSSHKSVSLLKADHPGKSNQFKPGTRLNQLPKPQKMSPENHRQTQSNPIVQKIAAAYYLFTAKMENEKTQHDIAENEKTAINILLKYNKAQDVYFEHYGYYARTPDNLMIKGENVYTVIDPDLGILNSANSPKQAVNGYYYVQTKNPGTEPGHIDQYLLNAIPADYGNSGVNTFYIDQKGIVIETNNGGHPVYQPVMLKKPNINKPKVKPESNPIPKAENL